MVKKAATGGGPRARLDLRGKRYEEAMQELDAFIDQALLNNMSQVDIIHGIGTGVIREAVTKYLRRNKHVKSFGYAPQNAGGSGCTIANLGWDVPHSFWKDNKNKPASTESNSWDRLVFECGY